MKKVVMIAGVVIICILCIGKESFVVDAENNLIENYGFEENLYYWDWKNVTMERVTDNPNSGDACAKVVMRQIAARGRYAFNFRPGVTYQISIWTRLESGSDIAQIMVSHNDLYGLTDNIISTQSYNVGTKWTQLTTTFRFHGEQDMGWAWISVYWGRGKTTPTHYLDDLSVVVVGNEENYHETPVKEGEIAVNTSLDRDTAGYVVKGAALDIVRNNTYLGTQGSGRVKITEDGGYVGQAVDLKAGKRYRLSSRVRTDSTVLPFKYVIDFSNHADVSPQMMVRDVFAEADRNWTLLETEFTYTGEKDLNSVLVYLRTGSGQKNITYYLDDFSIVEVNQKENTNSAGGSMKSATENWLIHLKNGEMMKNGKRMEISHKPYLSQSTVMGSGVEFSEILGVAYQEENGVILIGEGEKMVQLKVGSRILIKNNIAFPLPAAPVKTQNGIDVPIEVIAECAGLLARYDGETGTMGISN